SLVIMGAFENCADTRFSSEDTANKSTDISPGDINPGDNPGDHPESCETVINQLDGKVYLLFVVDTSGSNIGIQVPEPTDPDKRVRSGSIQAFFDDHKHKVGFHWGFITFGGKREDESIPDIKALINSGSDSAPSFTNNLSVVQSAIDRFNNMDDFGATPYLSALETASRALRGIGSADPNAKYIVVFMSDGLPTGNYTDDHILDEVNKIVGHYPGQTTFNTVYYGGISRSSANRLKRMADTGAGRFLDTNANPSGKNFQISNVINVPGVVCTH
ncbi:MAG: hypothetical protein AB7P49_16985, partial [Bdellovibrionales bacterium]